MTRISAELATSALAGPVPDRFQMQTQHRIHLFAASQWKQARHDTDRLKRNARACFSVLFSRNAGRRRSGRLKWIRNPGMMGLLNDDSPAQDLQQTFDKKEQ